MRPRGGLVSLALEAVRRVMLVFVIAARTRYHRARTAELAGGED